MSKEEAENQHKEDDIMLLLLGIVVLIIGVLITIMGDFEI